MIKITLPLPSAKLSQNARFHWAVKSKIAKQHRKAAHRAAWEQHPEGFRAASYKLVFYWPNAIRRDKDNASARCKNYLDGIADWTKQDDCEWGFSGVEFHIDKTNPRVEIHFETID
jgi:hypothetical protein